MKTFRSTPLLTNGATHTRVCWIRFRVLVLKKFPRICFVSCDSRVPASTRQFLPFLFFFSPCVRKDKDFFLGWHFFSKTHAHEIRAQYIHALNIPLRRVSLHPIHCFFYTSFFTSEYRPDTLSTCGVQDKPQPVPSEPRTLEQQMPVPTADGYGQ